MIICWVQSFLYFTIFLYTWQKSYFIKLLTIMLSKYTIGSMTIISNHIQKLSMLYFGAQHILCCVFVLFVFILCLVYPILLVSLDCPMFIDYKWTLLVSYVPHQLQIKTDWIEKLCNSMSTSTYFVSWTISENYFSFMICQPLINNLFFVI